MKLKTRSAPYTSNPDAAALIKAATAKCAGCRNWWRLTRWTHGGPLREECTAKVERQALREIAARRRVQP